MECECGLENALESELEWEWDGVLEWVFRVKK